MRSIKKFGIAFVALLAITLAGCATPAASGTSNDFNPSTVQCTEDGLSELATELETAEAELRAAKAKAEEFKDTPGETEANEAIDVAQAKIDAIKDTQSTCEAEAEAAAKAKAEADAKRAAAEQALAQCRVDALLAYMGEQGFSDGQYVIGEERVDATAPEFSRQGTLGFRQDDELPATRKAFQRMLSDNENPTAVAIKEQAEANNLALSEVLNARNWEIVQVTVDSLVLGNTGLSGESITSMGDTASASGDAAWIFINPGTCTVPRMKIKATGESVPEGTPLQDQPALASRIGCNNPTGGFKPVPPPPVTPAGKDWTQSVARPGGVTPMPSGTYEPPESVQPSGPQAPALTPGTIPTSTSQAPGASTPDTGRDIGAPATGTTPSGDTGSVNPTTGPNNTDEGNPFG